MSKYKQITPKEALKLLLDNEDYPEVRGGVYPSPFDMANGSYLLVGVDLSQEFPFIVIFQKGEGGMRMKHCWITEP